MRLTNILIKKKLKKNLVVFKKIPLLLNVC